MESGSAPDSNDFSCSLVDTTSPSQLEEVTFDQNGSLSNTMGLRSPSCPMRGRSVKEFEEQLANLKKENFNLKLRIYFLEEKMGINFTLDKDNIVKKNIELQVEVANLQKDIKEKHELLCQALKAMEFEDEEHKKYSQSKEEQIAQLQQELEDLRLQIHETSRYDSGLTSVTSNNTTSYSSKRPSSTRIAELEEKTKILECELQYERETNASLQLIIDQAQTFRSRCETLQKENDSKEETIDKLNSEINSANKRLIEFADQVKEYERKLAASHEDNQKIMKKMQADHKQLEDLHTQMTDISKKLNTTKYELDKERKRLERNKTINDIRIAELENQNESYKLTVQDLQSKLEAAHAEAKQNHNLAVSKSPALRHAHSRTDVMSISVADAAAPDGTAQEDPLHVQVAAVGDGEVTATTMVPPASPFALEQVSGVESMAAGEVGGNVSTDYDHLRNANATLKQKIVDLKSERIKACEIIKHMIEKRTKQDEQINVLKKKNADLERELESVVSRPVRETEEEPNALVAASDERDPELAVGTPPCENPMDQSLAQDIEITEHYQALTLDLEAKIEVLVATLHEKDLQMQHIHTKYNEILTNLEEKENRIVDLEFELLSNTSVDNKSLFEKSDVGTEKHSSFYKQEIEEKNKKIEKLNEELKKCTCYLQEIVNKELWDKNREIEKMHQKQENTTEIIKLRKEVSGKDMQLKLLKEKISELGINITIPAETSNNATFKELTSPTKNVEHIRTLQEQLKSARAEKEYFENKVNELQSDSQNNVAELLRSENEKLLLELEKSEKLRLETHELCSVLGNRLEELAIFLDSLLKQKSVLGFLGLAKNRKLRAIIDTSLDLSRSFTMNLIGNPEHSLAHLSNITDILNGSVFQELTINQEDDGTQLEDEEESNLSIVPSNITLTYRSHLYKKDDEPNNEEVITALREQVFSLKKELQLRDNELNKLTTKEFTVKKQGKTTETEEDKEGSTWLAQTSPNKCNTSTTLKCHSEVHSESEAWSEPDRVVSRARIGLNYTVPGALKESYRFHSNDSTEEDSSLDHVTSSPSKKRSSVIELHQQILELEDEVTRKSAELNRIESRSNTQYLETLEKQLEESRGKLQEAVDELSLAKQLYEQNLSVKDRETQEKITQLEIEKDHCMKLANDFQNEAMHFRNEMNVLKERLSEETKTIEDNLRREYELAMISKLKNAEEEFIRRVKKVQEKSETETRCLKEQIKTLEEEYKNNYLKKCDVEQKLAEVDRLVTQLEELKATVQSYEETIDSYRVKEHEINDTLQKYQDQICSIRRELDNSTLQYSEAVLEKTRIANEKAQLEQELSKRNIREMELTQQISNIQVEYAGIADGYQQQVALLQKQKSVLEVKVSELESVNAEIHNRLVRLQVSRHRDFNVSLPNIESGSVHIAYRRQYSDQTYNSSEDNTDDIRLDSNRPHDLDNRLQDLVNRPHDLDNRPHNLHNRPHDLDNRLHDINNRPHNINNRPHDINNRPHDFENRPHGLALRPDRHEANSSPDLGIESDQGRFSSLETQAQVPRPLLHTIELTESMSNLLDGDRSAVEGVSIATQHCCQKSLDVELENNELKRKLLRMKRALEETASQLNLANQRKKQVEKTICKQIHKTSQVLRKAKANLDSGSESDVFKT